MNDIEFRSEENSGHKIADIPIIVYYEYFQLLLIRHKLAHTE